ncbi:hypothetical protein [Kiloniella sp.]|uniref:hypothetical protein n=1 Tax=Kiloniella sp. TaxID=1938587 RepID=UPI003B02D26B
MVDNRERLQGVVPERMAEAAPNYSQPSHDFTLQAVMELQKSVGKLEATLDNVAQKIDDQKNEVKGVCTRLDAVDKTLNRTIGGAVVSAILIVAASSVVWWLIGDTVVNMRDQMISAPVVIKSPVVDNVSPKKK